MNVTKTPRGFEIIEFETYPPNGETDRLVQESSAINADYDDSFSNPGSSYLWIGKNHHINREEVSELITYLQNWLDTGHLSG